MKISVPTGAGISAESGLPTFRDKRDGLWAKFDPMKLATPQAFNAAPALVHEFYNLRRRLLHDVEPNAAYHALVRLAEHLAKTGGELNIITQNVDDLHERAGSARVVHIHGELMQVKCTACARIDRWETDLGVHSKCTGCETTGCLRPNVVWFGETPYRMDEVSGIVARSNLFAAIGTSGSVYPAAGLVRLAASHGVWTCELNLDPSENRDAFDDAHYGSASAIVSEWVETLINKRTTG